MVRVMLDVTTAAVCPSQDERAFLVEICLACRPVTCASAKRIDGAAFCGLQNVLFAAHEMQRRFEQGTDLRFCKTLGQSCILRSSKCAFCSPRNAEVPSTVFSPASLPADFQKTGCRKRNIPLRHPTTSLRATRPASLVPVDPALSLYSLYVFRQLVEGHLPRGVARARLAGNVVEPALVLNEVACEL